MTVQYRGRFAGPQCLNCDAEIAEGEEHFLINHRPWCLRCGKQHGLGLADGAGLALKLLLLSLKGAVVFAPLIGGVLLGAVFGKLALVGGFGLTALLFRVVFLSGGGGGFGGPAPVVERVKGRR